MAQKYSAFQRGILHAARGIRAVPSGRYNRVMHTHAASRIRILVAVALFITCVVCAVDALVWHMRNARGQGTQELPVTQVTAAQLKRSREEYYVDSAITITCADSLLPQLISGGWLPPCWYVRRNQIVIHRV